MVTHISLTMLYLPCIVNKKETTQKHNRTKGSKKQPKSTTQQNKVKRQQETAKVNNTTEQSQKAARNSWNKSGLWTFNPAHKVLLVGKEIQVWDQAVEWLHHAAFGQRQLFQRCHAHLWKRPPQGTKIKTHHSSEWLLIARTQQNSVHVFGSTCFLSEQTC